MSNDVVMVAIPKELRDKVVLFLESENSSPKRREMIQALRAAPETVSLEGVERFSESSTNGMIRDLTRGDWVRFSDLRRLVAPVQPNAVVSREAISDAFETGIDYESVSPEITGEEISNGLDAVHALQLPKPQTVGRVDLSIDEADDILTEFQKCGCNNPAHLRDLINAHLQAHDESEVGP